jgi:hypothetical protein
VSEVHCEDSQDVIPILTFTVWSALAKFVPDRVTAAKELEGTFDPPPSDVPAEVTDGMS